MNPLNRTTIQMAAVAALIFLAGTPIRGQQQPRENSTLSGFIRGRDDGESDVGTGATCELSFEITGAVPIEPCATCAFAVEFELGALTVYRDEGACDESKDLQGTRMRFAQGSEVVADEGGTPRFDLYAEAEGIWERVEEGWSFILTSASEQKWLFGFSDS